MKKKVLIVDDEPLIRALMREFLEVRGEYEVREAESGQEGLHCFQEDRPQLAIVDNILPDGLGLDLLKHMREADATVPLILITGHKYVDLEAKAKEAGATRFLVKPFTLDTFLQVVDDIFAADSSSQRAD